MSAGAEPVKQHLAPFRVDVHPERDVVRVVPVGELDLATAALLERELHELRDSGFDHVVLDMHNLSFIDSSGLRELVIAARRARRAGYPFRAVNPSEHIRRLFELTALDKTIAVAPADG